ncbi:MAG: DUF2555 domain-containing protein [Cyanothece sp. SIO1E1]|nr:DUF2555 domain-containing protein [Cyanothece sp. SIO1E1]
MSSVSFSTRTVSELTKEAVDELAVRLEKDEYESAFDCLNDWHLLRAIAFQRPELVEAYLHLLDMEAYDEE